MAKFNAGILTAPTGKVGPIVAANWRGIEVMRAKPRKTNRVPTEKQANQKLKFALVADFLRPFGGLFRDSFGNQSVETGTNKAFSYTMKNAVTGESPNYSIDYTKVMVSRGGIPIPELPAVVLNGTQLNFSWRDNSGNGKALATDTAILVVYCPAKSQAVYKTVGFDRKSQAGSLDITAFRGQDIHTYIGFLSAEKQEVSDSVYTGKLTVA